MLNFAVMKLTKYLYITIAALVMAASFVIPEVYAAPAAGSSVASVSASSATSSSKKRSSSRSKKKSRKSKTSKKKRRSKSRKKSKKRSSYRSNYKRPAPAPVEKPSNDSLTLSVNEALVKWVPKDINPGGLRVNRVNPNKRQATIGISLNENFTYMPVTRELIGDMTKVVRKILPDSISDYNITLNVGNRNYSYYINKIDKLPEKYRTNVPFVREVKPYISPKHGMEGDIVALWHSHGRYFRGGGWSWQRGFLFQSLEDTYTMGYVLPYLVPMLENAGAYVMLPRERDYNRHEVIVDNDTNEGGLLFSQTNYKEQNGQCKWATGEEEGFIYDLPDFRDTENPFENGTYRQAATQHGGKPSVAGWYPDIPEDGEYAVYVSYKTLPNSTTDARYTVNYSGGSKEFKVNQTMGGGTWIYLGTFPLKEGLNTAVPVVSLTNLSDKGGDTVVTADAVKIGGGMGNIARSSNRSDIYYDPSTPDKSVYSKESSKTSDVNPDDEEADEEGEIDEEDEDEGDDESGDDESDVDNEENENVDGEQDCGDSTSPAEQKPAGRAPVFRTSGLPRYLEGARYWLHWAGFPESVYSPYHGRDDYKDDYTNRGMWVNYLAGGSRVLPNRPGLNIPVDISFALHSDAGKRADDSIVGTLGIYYTNGGDSYADGTPRSNSRMLTDMLMRQITSDIRRTYEPHWTRRSMWDKSYLEARVAEVPTTLIELLSHQNFGDMQYGLDPNFKFVASRAIYKAMARFIGERKGREVVIQPLPVHNFAIKEVKKGHYRLSWVATKDSIEPTATPNKYIILERTEGTLGFHLAGETSSTHFDVKVKDDLIHSYKVLAANEGGQSFPSEILSLRAARGSAPTMLIVNGFSRVSAPGHFSANGNAGFNAEEDFGVPYINDASFPGFQTEFRRSAGDGFGRSASNYVGTVVAGNIFDYPSIHGEAVADAGYSFVSCSAGAVEAGNVNLGDYKIVDLILGKQKRTIVGRGTSGVRYAAFPQRLRNAIATYVKKGGHLIVTGQYVASDLYDSRGDSADRDFAAEVLGISHNNEAPRQRGGKIQAFSALGGKSFSYSNNINEEQYIVENPDVLVPASDAVRVLANFAGSDYAAGVSSRYGKGRTVVMSIPFESVKDEEVRSELMEALISAVSR